MNLPTEDDLKIFGTSELEAFILTEAPEELIITGRYMLAIDYHNQYKIPLMAEHVKLIRDYANKENSPFWLARASRIVAQYKSRSGNRSKALDEFRKALAFSEKSGDELEKVKIMGAMSSTLLELELFEEAEKIDREVHAYYSTKGITRAVPSMNLGLVLMQRGKFNEALKFLNEALAVTEDKNILRKASLRVAIGSVYKEAGDLETALTYFKTLLDEAQNWGSEVEEPAIATQANLGEVYAELNDYENALHHCRAALINFEKINKNRSTTRLSKVIAAIYKSSNKFEEAYEYLEKSIEYAAKVSDQESLQKAQNIEHQLEVERREKEFEVRLANTKLQTLTKIASDIAHEVQNPLQFVNNFSVVNMELVDELNEYQSMDDDGFVDVKKKLKDNSQKIHDYGIRISQIVDQLQEQTRKAEAKELELDGEN